jgi:hypothetical protein
LSLGRHAIIFPYNERTFQEVVVAKQTGRRCAVKTARAIALIMSCAAGLALAGCAGEQWYNPRKSAQEASADEATCNARAEDAALIRARKQRADYRMPAPATEPGLSRGETPMELVDRNDTTKDFTKQFENCMTSKGYTLGKPAP